MEYRRAGITALIFDFDGTLANQTIDYTVMKQEAVAAARRFAPLTDFPHLPTVELLAQLDLATTAGKNALAAALAAIARVEVAAAARSALFPFVRPMLARLPELGLRMGIITRNCREAIAAVFPDAEDHAALFTRDDVPRVKPDPIHLQMALDRLAVRPENALMIGDHPMDIAVGKTAGTKTAAVATGYHSAKDLATCAPDYMADNGQDLLIRLGLIQP